MKGSIENEIHCLVWKSNQSQLNLDGWSYNVGNSHSITKLALLGNLKQIFFVNKMLCISFESSVFNAQHPNIDMS